MKLWKLFLLSVLLTTGVGSVHFYLHRRRAPEPKQIYQNVYLTSQLQTSDLPSLLQRGIKTVVDMRPDGESEDQPPSNQIQSAAGAYGLKFYYIPVPHEGIPSSAVEALDRALTPEALPAVLYCRTGRRAVRLFALMQASRVDGPDVDAIMQMVSAARFSADDLRDEITQRYSHRSSAPTPTVTHQ